MAASDEKIVDQVKALPDDKQEELLSSLANHELEHADDRDGASFLHPFDDKPDDTLVGLMLEQKISDRLRTLCHHVRAQQRFRPL